MEAPQLEVFEDINRPPVRTIKLRPGSNLDLADVIAVEGQTFGIVVSQCGSSGERYVALPLDAAQSTIDKSIRKGLRPKLKAVIDIDTIAA